MKTIRIGIAEDHKLFRQSLEMILNDQPEFNVLFCAGSGLNLLKQLRTYKPDIVLLDLFMPDLDGFDSLNIIKNEHPDIKVIILSSYYEDNFINESIKNGARGFLSKNISFDTLTNAITGVDTNGYHYDNKVTPSLLDQLQVQTRP